MIEMFNETQRQLTICNGCRYCEGFCAVWDAMERRSDFGKSDVKYLANLCHDCRDCYYACPYTPPHEYRINIPRIFSSVRLETYSEYAWPGASILMHRPISATILLESASILLMLLFVYMVNGLPGLLVAHSSFYDVIPEAHIDAIGLSLGAYVIAVWLIGLFKFWKDIYGSPKGFLNFKALLGGSFEALTHKWFRGGGAGCDYPSERGSYARLPLHSMAFLGFLATLIATIIAAIYERFLLFSPPYSLTSLPVLFGAIGGGAIVLGSVALIHLKGRSARNLAERKMLQLDYAFIAVLGLAAITGLLTLILRESSIMGLVFAVHMGTVLALFLATPYGKFVHVVYRFAALVKNQLEIMQEKSFR